MSLVTVAKLLLPPPWLEGDGALSTLNAADDRIAFVVTVPKSGVLDKFEFLIGDPVSVNAASVIRVSFRVVVGATGEPAGGADQYRDILGSALLASTWISPGLMTDTGADGGAKRTVTRGDLIVLVIEYQSFTAADSFPVSTTGGRSTAGMSGSSDGFPYNLFQASGSWSKTTVDEFPAFALLYDDGSYGSPLAPGHVLSAASSAPTYNTASTPDERGNRFTLPFPVRATGAWVSVRSVLDTADFEVVLIDTDESTELEAVAVDGAHSADNTITTPRFIPFATPQELTDIDGVYRLTVRPTTVNNVKIQNAVVANAAMMESLFNKNFHGTSRVNLGAWTDAPRSFYHVGLVLDAIEEGSGGGGGGGGATLSDRGFVRGMIT